MKKFLIGFVLISFLISLMSNEVLASACKVQLRTFEKNGNPDTVFYPVGENHIQLPLGKRFDIYVQWQSQSANPYLLSANVGLVGGNSVNEKSQDIQYGSVRIDTVKLGYATFSYKIDGRSDGKVLNLPVGCESGTFSVEVVSPKSYFDLALAQAATRDLSQSVVQARSLAYQEGSWFLNQISDLDLQVRRVNAAIANSGGDVLLIENELNVVGSQIANLRSLAFPSSSYVLQMQIERVEFLYLRLLQVVAPE